MPNPQFISKSELCQFLGVSLATVNRRLKDNTIRSVKIGARVLIPFSETERLLQAAGAER